MCHGVGGPLTVELFEELMLIAHELGFESISYDDLAEWVGGTDVLPDRPIMIDFDHPERSIIDDMKPILERLGYTGNLFV
jgi:hypothetical protein